MSKMDLFNQVKELKYPKNVNSLFDILEDYIDRVEFVKDHVGLSNFLFVAEKEANGFEYPYFACFNIDVKENDEQHNFVSMNQSIIYDLKEINNDMLTFFKEDNGTLYVEIGFKESMPTQEDQFLILQLLKDKECDNIQEALARVRKFPDWYKAKFSKNIQEEFDVLTEMEKAEKYLTHKLKVDLVAQINQSLIDGNKEQFILLTNRYKKATEDF